MAKFVYDYTKRSRPRKKNISGHKMSSVLIAFIVIVFMSFFFLLWPGIRSPLILKKTAETAANDKATDEADKDIFKIYGNYTATDPSVDEEKINGFMVRYQEYPGAACKNETASCIGYLSEKMGMGKNWVANLYYFKCIDSTVFGSADWRRMDVGHGDSGLGVSSQCLASTSCLVV